MRWPILTAPLSPCRALEKIVLSTRRFSVRAALGLWLLALGAGVFSPGPAAWAQQPLVQRQISTAVSLVGEPAQPVCLEEPRFTDPISAEQLRLAFYDYSAPSIVKALRADNDRYWNHIMEHIVNGDGEWIYYAINVIAPGADPESLTDLTASLAMALPVNPVPVLVNPASGISLGKLCSAPFVEPEPLFLQAYLRAAQAAVENMEDEEAVLEKAMCLVGLNQALERLTAATSAPTLAAGK